LGISLVSTFIAQLQLSFNHFTETELTPKPNFTRSRSAPTALARVLIATLCSASRFARVL